MKILAVKKDHCKKAQEALLKLLHITKEKNIQVLLQEKDFVKGNTEIFTDQRVDLGIALGGDGTMLRLSSLIQKYQKAPRVASFSLGTLGFLLPLKKMEEIVGDMIDDKNTLINRMRLKCTFKGQEFHALNEVVVHRGLKPHLARLDVFSENQLLTDADGLIISTPSGSTAYSLSAGGPLVHPGLDLFIMTPICPQSLSFRPILLTSNSQLRIQLSGSSRNTANVSVDGQHFCNLKKGEYIEIQRSEYDLPTVVLPSKGQNDWISNISSLLKVSTGMSVYLLDYGAGNVRSLVNAVEYLGFTVTKIEKASDFDEAEVRVGTFGTAINALQEMGFLEPLKAYLESNKPFMGICVGMQVLFRGSDESPDAKGIGLIPGVVERFSTKNTVPHMGWNTAVCPQPVKGAMISSTARYYFVHSFRVSDGDLDGWNYSSTTYGSETFVSSVLKGSVFATQFHPEKSGPAGLEVLRSFLLNYSSLSSKIIKNPSILRPEEGLSKRIIACLDVRTNDEGDLVVTKGDQYDVREKEGRSVRNLGKPVDLAKRYYEEGADEIVFLNITSFRQCPLKDTPMLRVLEATSKSVFVPLTIGGGIRNIIEPDGSEISALTVAGEYFRSGADKVSIGSDAVFAAEKFYKSGGKGDGTSAIEQISKVYGAQAVVISVDPRRVYVQDPSETPHHVIRTNFTGPKGERFCWYQCTVKGGRECRDLDIFQLVHACISLGAGEFLVNSMDKDGTNSGFDLELLNDVKSISTVPVIASSGAGKPEHFSELFNVTNAEAGLAAGIFHRKEVPISAVKAHLEESGYKIRC